MLQRIQTRVVAHLARKGIRGDNEIYVYLISLAATVFCLAVHSYLLVVFLAYQVPLFAWVNAASIAVYVVLR